MRITNTILTDRQTDRQPDRQTDSINNSGSGVGV